MRSIGGSAACALLCVLLGCGRADVRPHEAAGDSAEAFAHLLALADSQYNRGRLDSARRTLDDEISRAGQLHDSIAVARGWTTLSIVARWQGEYDEAQSLGERSVALKRRLGMNAELARSLNALGLLANNRGNYDEAIRRLRETFDAAEAVHDSAYMARARGNLGLAFSNMGDVDHARTEFTVFRDFAVKTGAVRDEANALTNLGMLETRTGDPSAAVAVLGTARARYSKIGFDGGEENALGQLGVAWEQLGQTARALAYFDSALAIARRDGLREQEGDDLELIAEIYDNTGDHRRALEVLGRARLLADSLKMQSKLAHVLLTEARAYAALGASRLALARANDAARHDRIADSPIDELSARLEAAMLAERMGETSVVDSALARARVLVDNLGSGIARVQFALGAARVADQGKRSDDVLEQLDRMGQDTVLLDSGERSEREALRARAFFRQGDFAAAATAGGRAVAAIERFRGNIGSPALRTSYGVDRAETYSDLVVALLALNRVDSAFRIADAARGRALIEQLSAARHELPRTGAAGELVAADSLLRRINSLIERMRIADATGASRRDRSAPPPSGALEGELAIARASYDSLLDRMSRSDSRSAIVGARTVDVSAVKRSLAADERLVEYVETRERLLAFVVSRDSVTVVQTSATSASIAEQAELAREFVSTRRREASGPLGALYASLIAPLDRRGVLAGARHLIIVPHGALSYLPFATLRAADRGQYLVERFSILTLTSASALVPLRAGGERVATGGSRVFAPLTRQLPSSRAEAADVASALGVTPSFDSSASERALREALASASIVHVATHGTLDAERPMLSSILLAPQRSDGSSANDGRLETHEVLALPVVSRLVYLSGCETALGAATPTSARSDEDYATLAQAFLFAGARNVVATLWRIDDRGAAEFASRFYAALAKSSPADALAAAQRQLMRDPRYAAPYYWAAYSISGAGSIR